MKKKKQVIRFLLTVLFLILSGIFVKIYTGMERSNENRIWYQFLTGVCLAGAILCLSGESGKVFFASFKDSVRKILEGIFGSRTGKEYHAADYIRGFHDESYHVRKQEKGVRAARKRYKEMDNRERIRYFYSELLKKQRRKGFSFSFSNTANEIGRKMEEEKRISEKGRIFFQKYNEARYNLNADITSEEVEKMKKIYKNPKL